MLNRRWAGLALVGVLNFLVSLVHAETAQRTVPAPPVPVPGPIVATGIDDGKGTIGLICIDENGNQVTWREQNRGVLEQCMERVLENQRQELLRSGIDSQTVNFNNLIEGFQSYELMVEGLRWSQQLRRPTAPRQ